MEKVAQLSFFFPAYNEEANIEAVVKEALLKLPEFAETFEVVIINDGSKDNTPKLADALVKSHPGLVRVVHHSPNRGYGGAVRSGINNAQYPLVFFTDGDQQFKLDDLGRLLEGLDKDTDVVIGYRIKRNDPFKRLVIARVYKLVLQILFRSPFKDVDCAYKLFRSDVFKKVPLENVYSNGAFFSAELLLCLKAGGVRIKQVGIPHYPRSAGLAAGAAPHVIWRTLKDIVNLRLRLDGTP